MKPSYELQFVDGRTHTISGQIPPSPPPNWHFQFVPQANMGWLTLHHFQDEHGFHKMWTTAVAEMCNSQIRRLVIDLRTSPGGSAAVGDILLRGLTAQPIRQLRKVTFRVSPTLKRELKKFLLPPALRWLPLQYLSAEGRRLWRAGDGEFVSLDFPETVMKWPEKPFSGEVIVLIGPRTISSASLLAATIRHYRLGTLIGAGGSGSATHYGNIWTLALPHSGLHYTIPTSINEGHEDGPLRPDRALALPAGEKAIPALLDQLPPGGIS
jgi:C-terminal processing protease CtpA/Prc